jgi:hypothetical protein
MELTAPTSALRLIPNAPNAPSGVASSGSTTSSVVAIDNHHSTASRTQLITHHFSPANQTQHTKSTHVSHQSGKQMNSSCQAHQPLKPPQQNHTTSNGPVKVVITTDSQYVKNGIEGWIIKWKKNGWRTAKGDPVKNKQLWEDLDAQLHRLKQHHFVIEWQWVKGHSGDYWNERVDKLANEEAQVAQRTKGAGGAMNNNFGQKRKK